jgi:hypothetical protein
MKGIVLYAIIPVRSEPSDKAELSTELLFGEVYSVLQESSNGWLFVRNEADSYEGWISVKLHTVADSGEASALKPTRRIVEWVEDLTGGISFPVPLASRVPAEGNVLRAGKRSFKTLTRNPGEELNPVTGIAPQLVNTPYRWGGKTPFGIDCSGFTQNIKLLQGYALYRDAWQQAQQGELISFLSEAETGDLAFFDNEEGKIIHTGIIEKRKDLTFSILHASGCVRRDALDHLGIHHSDTQQYSHRLRLIRRIS